MGIRRARQLSTALSELTPRAVLLRGRPEVSALRQTDVSVLHLASSGKDLGAAGEFSPLLQTAGSRSAAAAGAMSQTAKKRSPETRSAPRIIYRYPESRLDSTSQKETGESSGEEVLRAQTVSPARAAAMNQAYSYPPVSSNSGGRSSKMTAEPLTREQEDRITQRVLEDINYNRMASEVLDRVERRLRAERRKFGR